MQEIISNHLFLGPFGCGKDLNLLKSRAITDIVLARSSSESAFLKPRSMENGIQYHVIEIEDSVVESSAHAMTKFLHFMTSRTDADRVLVLGMSGMNRSATLVAIYLIEKFLLSPESAIEYLITRRRCVGISVNLKRQLLEFSTARAAAALAAGNPTERRKRRIENDVVEIG